MPSRNIIKPYIAGGIYHIYNRGVEKRIIFIDQKDYTVFLRFLKEALLNPVLLNTANALIPTKRRSKNFFGTLDLLAYCLMPNHFHLLVKQQTERGIEEFMQSLATRYSIYFNWRHERIGCLFQNTYKATHISDEPYLLHVSRYIHRNPSEYTDDLTTAYSSYAEYLGIRNTQWVKSQEILSYFSHSTTQSLTKQFNSYQSFVEDIDDAGIEMEEIIKANIGLSH